MNEIKAMALEISRAVTDHEYQKGVRPICMPISDENAERLRELGLYAYVQTGPRGLEVHVEGLLSKAGL